MYFFSEIYIFYKGKTNYLHTQLLAVKICIYKSSYIILRSKYLNYTTKRIYNYISKPN